jgi:phospholipid/cholesterol/gamma-HCH transport system substrate-binding protein
MKLSNEAKIGLMVFAVIGILAFLTIKTGKFNVGQKGYTLQAVFDQIDGVSMNSPVFIQGYEQGYVKDIQSVEESGEMKMVLTLWLEEGARVKEGVKASIKTMGFMGEKYLALNGGAPGGAFLKQGSTIVGSKPADLDALLKDAQEVAGELKVVSQNIRERLEKNKESIDNVLAKASAIADNIDERLRVNEVHIDHLMAHLDSASVNLDQFTYDLKLHPWKLMYRSKEKRAESIKLMDQQ